MCYMCMYNIFFIDTEQFEYLICIYKLDIHFELIPPQQLRFSWRYITEENLKEIMAAILKFTLYMTSKLRNNSKR